MGFGVDVLHGVITAEVYQHVPADTGLARWQNAISDATVNG
ncbi:hypothetical protein ACNKHT_12360 [Shigella flexneri]